MKIVFIVSNQSMSVGSYRIWIHDFSKYLKFSGCEIKITGNINEICEDTDVVILSKGDYKKSEECRSVTSCLIGAINFSNTDKHDKNIDFIITGSPEERLSLLPKYNNVFIVNLIEEMHNRNFMKLHEDKSSVLTIGIHGSYTHVPKLSYGFIDAVEEINNENPGTFKILSISNQPKNALNFFNRMGISKTELQCKEWEYLTFLHEIEQMDIGVVCNTSDLTKMHPELDNIFDPEVGLYKSDYAIRFKNKSNPGRAFVFFQSGIPIIADMTPSHFPMLFDAECGFLASNKESWKNALNKLRDAKLRQGMAEKANIRFMNLYSMQRDADNLVKKIKEIIDVRHQQ